MSMLICMHMSKQSRRIKASAAKSASTASLEANSRWQIAAYEGGAGTTPPGGECLGLCWEIDTLAPFWEGRQQLTAIVKLTQLLTHTEEEGEKCTIMQRSSHFGKSLLAPALFLPAT